jgi:hypothetical protein
VSEDNKELVRRHFEEIFNRENFAVCDEMMAEEYFEHAPAPFSESAPGRVNGPRAMRRSAEWLLAQFPDLHMTIEAMVAEEDTVAVRVLSEGTNLGLAFLFLCFRSASTHHFPDTGCQKLRSRGS